MQDVIAFAGGDIDRYRVPLLAVQVAVGRRLRADHFPGLEAHIVNGSNSDSNALFLQIALVGICGNRLSFPIRQRRKQHVLRAFAHSQNQLAALFHHGSLFNALFHNLPKWIALIKNFFLFTKRI